MKEILDQIEDFLGFCRFNKNLGEKTLVAYNSDLGLFADYLAMHPDANITSYVSYMAKNHKISTIKRHLATIKQYYKYVYRNNRLDNPILKYEFKLKEERGLPRTMSIHSVKKLLKAAEEKRDTSQSNFQIFQSIRDVALIDLLCSTGIRIGEAAAIQMEDIDLRTRIILIHGKGKKERLIYISCLETMTNLKAWICLRKTIAPNHNFLFINRNRCPISIHAIEDIFYKYRDLAKINLKVTPHYLRHTFATNLLANGADLRSVQEILGHSNISITERYTEVTTTRKIKVLKKYNYRNRF